MDKEIRPTSEKEKIPKKVIGGVQDFTKKAVRKTSSLLGLGDKERYDAYLSIIRASNPFDLNYWLELFFSCGIATLGLALNSPATIIGAMLISPLMGPIMGSGLALATGDFFLGLRASLNLVLSIGVSILAADWLVTVLPFKQITPEILSRIQPTVLDLSVAILCGFAGVFAILKSTKGIVTAIPGVAIAVALMPPLSVIGFGLGVRGTLPQWKEVMMGGGLLFAANFVAIVLTSMLVFLLVRMNHASVRADVDIWQRDSRHQTVFERRLAKFRIWKTLGKVGSLQARLIVVISFLVAISLPLHRAMKNLQFQVSSHREQESAQKLMNALAKDIFQKPDRSHLEKVFTEKTSDGYMVEVHTSTSEWFSADDRSRFEKNAAEKLKKPVRLVLVQIPSVVGVEQKTDWNSLMGLKEAPKGTAETTLLLREQLQKYVEGLWPKESGTLIDVEMGLAGMPDSMTQDRLKLVYLAEEDLSWDGKRIFSAGLERLMAVEDLDVQFHWLNPYVGSWTYPSAAVEPPEAAQKLLSQTGEILKAYPRLKSLIRIGASPESIHKGLAEERAKKISKTLEENGVSQEQISIELLPERGRTVLVRLELLSSG